MGKEINLVHNCSNCIYLEEEILKLKQEIELLKNNESCDFGLGCNCFECMGSLI